ncbi:hypothetical protein BDV35DRAFT_381057 [Aspergillus flavus]|uniref:Short chain dehydrogenase/reductase n=1 Tax=Aspergillus flavus TaxID=5059 RepID=A0A5N6GY47_ASPFL|nr:hypothetical protein BDV35DRAFT_381057 [Aspergillus flavus]
MLLPWWDRKCACAGISLARPSGWSGSLGAEVRLFKICLRAVQEEGNGSYIIDYTVPAMEVDLAEARATFETNFFAGINMCQTFLPLLKKAQGTIIQIGSVAGVIHYVFGSVYNASKAALHSFSDTLRVKLAPFGVNVPTIITGGVQSRIARVKRTLAPNSLYAPIEDEYNRRVIHSQDGAMSHTAYARSVVTQILYGITPLRWLWPWAKGHNNNIIRSYLVPTLIVLIH